MSDVKAKDTSSTILGIVLIIALTTLAAWIVYAMWSTAEGNRVTSEKVRTACIESGATWVGGSASACIQMPEPVTTP
jgi:hypothetical protein